MCMLLKYPSLRKKKSELIYSEYLKTLNDKCIVCSRIPLKKFKYWKIIDNHFPYDKIAKRHHMIAPYRHTIEEKLNIEELSELKKIKQLLKKSEYHYILEANHKSFPEHFHLHLIVIK